MFKYFNFSHFFSKIQETQWYYEFLQVVVDETSENSSLLDIGTGTGKLIEMLVSEKRIECIGIDTNKSMLEEAKKKLSGLDVELLKVDKGSSIPFNNNSFDFVSICNVLFNQNTQTLINILNESIRVLKQDGKLIILTPTGKKSAYKTKGLLSIETISFNIWKRSTAQNGRIWVKNNFLGNFCKNENLEYFSKLVFHDLALMEIISKKI